MCDVAAACCSLVAVSSHAVARSYKLPVHVLTQIGKAARAVSKREGRHGVHM
jgi:hypothetical protein